MAVQFQIRRSTSTFWTTANPILAQAEQGYEIDTRKMKIGDGINHWSNLPYFPSDSSTFDAVIDPLINTIGTTAKVDFYSGVIVSLTTTGASQTLQSPTSLLAGKSFLVVNNDTSTNNLVVNSNIIAPGKAFNFIWDGSAWLAIGGGGSFISLSDAPHSYAGKKGEMITVNSAETGIEFTPISADAERNSTGVLSGGIITPEGGILFTIAPGSGYIVNHNTETSTKITWDTLSHVSTIGDGVNYFCIDTLGAAHVFLTVPDKNLYLYLGACVATQGNTLIIDVENNPNWVDNFPDRVTEFASASIKTLIDSGLELSEQTLHPLKIHINPGVINTRLNVVPINPNDTLIKLFATSNYGFVPDTANFYSPADTVNTTHWNDITKPYGQSMIEMTDGYWKKDLIAILPNGNIFYVYGQEEFLTQSLAKIAPMQYIPPTTATAFVFLAFVVSRKGDTSIADRLIDIRPYFPKIWGLLGENADVKPANASINMMSTGLLNGGLLSINILNVATFDLTGGNAIIVDNTDILNPTFITVNWKDFTQVATPYLHTNDTTYIRITSTGIISFSTSVLTADERRSHIEIGWLKHPDRNTLSFVKTEPYYNASIQSQLNDFIESYSPFNISGNEYTFSTSSGLAIRQSSGSVFDGNSNYSNDISNPHIITTDATDPCDINYFYRNGSGGWVNDTPTVNFIDPNHYDNSGILTIVPTGSWTIQVITYYPVMNTNNIQYGQVVYNTYKEALSNLYSIIEINPFNSAGVFRAWLIVKQGATDLSNSEQAVFLNAGRIRLNDIIGGTENDQSIIETQSTGQVSGGFITPIGGIHFNVSAGSGYITDNSTFYKRVTWQQTNNLATVVDGRNFVMVDIEGNVFVTGIVDNYYSYIQVGVIFSGGGNTQLVEIINSPRSIRDFPQRVLRYQQIALQAICGSGCEVSERAAPDLLQLQINSGTIFVNMNEHIVNVTNSFTRMYNTSNYGWVPYTASPLNHIVPNIYNDVTKPYGSALVPLTDSYWKKDLVFRCPDGNVFIICGQAQYQSKDEARRAPLPTVPGQLGAVAVYLCAIICQKEDTSILNRIQDIRPNFARIFQEDTSENSIPAGGTTNQVLSKIDSTDFNTAWTSITAAGLNQEIQFNNNGSFGSDVNLKFDSINKSLLINGASALSNNPLSIQGDFDSFVQLNIQNKNSGINASADIVATADNGSDIINFVDLGITNSNYLDPIDGIWNSNDGYLLSNGGELTIGTETPTKIIKFHTGGTSTSNVIAEISDTGLNTTNGKKISENGFNLTDLITTASNPTEEAAAFAAGSKVVIRLDLL